MSTYSFLPPSALDKMHHRYRTLNNAECNTTKHQSHDYTLVLRLTTIVIFQFIASLYDDAGFL